jgi:hypothetical protein
VTQGVEIEPPRARVSTSLLSSSTEGEFHRGVGKPHESIRRCHREPALRPAASGVAAQRPNLKILPKRNSFGERRARALQQLVVVLCDALGVDNLLEPDSRNNEAPMAGRAVR